MIRIRKTVSTDVVRELDRQIFVASEHLSDRELRRNVWWVAYLDGTPVAYAGARACESLPQYAYLSRCGVLESARGRGLQRRLVRVRAAWARAQGHKHAITYTLPYNAHSSNNLIRCGFLTYADRYYGRGVVYWHKELK